MWEQTFEASTWLSGNNTRQNENLYNLIYKLSDLELQNVQTHGHFC
jgi:hypothetical protein